MKLRFVTKKLASSSLRRLANTLTEKLQYKVWRSRFHKPKRLNIQYGDCKDKITQYKYFAAENIPSLEFTTSHEEAKQWAQEGFVVVVRKLTRASEGKGILVAETPESIPLAPLYTKYAKKKKEFRVHIYNDNVVCVLEKRRKKGFDGGDAKIRNTSNGYVFCRQDVVEPEGIRELALKASKVTTSNFKGVDIGYNE